MIADRDWTNDEYLYRLYIDFEFFAEEIWRIMRLEQRAALGPLERDMLKFIAAGPHTYEALKLACGEAVDWYVCNALRGLLAPRGTGKTHFVAAYALWLLYRDPDHKVLIASKSTDAAKKTVFMIRGWVDNIPFLSHLIPTRDDRDTTFFFDVGSCKKGDRTPSLDCVGIDGHLENRRAHTIIADDVETESNTVTLEAREELDHRVKQFNALLYPGGEIVYLGTFNHEESLYIKLHERGYAFRTYTLEYPTDDERKQIINLAPMLEEQLKWRSRRPGDLTMPHRFDAEYVASKKLEGQSWYARQYQLIATLGDALRYPLKLSDLIVFPVSHEKAPISIAWGRTNDRNGSTKIEDIPMLGFSGDALHGPIKFDADWATFRKTVAWVDVAGEGTDETAWAIASSLNGYVFLRRVAGTQGGYSMSVLEQIARDMRDYRVQEVHLEDNFGLGMLATLLRPVLQRFFVRSEDEIDRHKDWACSVFEHTSRTQKESRIIGTLEPVMNQHRLIVDPACLMPERVDGKHIAYELQHQLTRITRQRNCLKHDDRLECVAGAVAQCVDMLDTDPEAAAQKQRDEALQKQIDEAIYEAEGRRPKNRWREFN